VLAEQVGRLTGVTAAQRAALLTLGAVDHEGPSGAARFASFRNSISVSSF
jgi:hypothetical protein